MSSSPDRILLSVAEVDAQDVRAVSEAVLSGWLSPAGPALNRFEAELAEATGRRYAVGLSSGTAALHLGLLALGIQPGDEVWTSTLTFVATANAVVHAGATPVFFDVDESTWTIDVNLVREELERRIAVGGRLPSAVLPVDLYGRCADLGDLFPLLSEYGIPVLTDAAESLGASISGRPAGSTGAMAALSFNGNKIITTSGGGAVVTDDEHLAARVRHLATQAREPVRHYEHVEIGFNQRLSNVLAALGSSQLSSLGRRVERRRGIHERYVAGFADVAGVRIADELRDDDRRANSIPSRWLTCIILDPEVHGVERDSLIDALESQGIESRPVWKPIHLQPAYQDTALVGGRLAVEAFDLGIALPSGSGLSDDQIDRVIDAVRLEIDSFSSMED
jgi:dTDP-4-amino-4,6-dideoxygalactose transaminase